MSLTTNLLGQLWAHSKAMYASWYYHPAANVLFDCGEGLATRLSNFVFGIEHVFISHSHFDHCGGLPALLLSRHTARGDTEKPLTIHYPDDDRFFKPLKAYAESVVPRNVDYEITWAPYDPDNPAPVPVNIKGQRVQPFRSSHVPYLKTFSFVIEEERKRLKPEFASLSQDALRERAMAAKAAGEPSPSFNETYHAPILAYSGDALPIDPARIEGCGLVIHESTFLLAKDLDPKKRTHTALEDLIPHLVAANVQGALITHISARYTRKEIDAAFRRELDRHQPAFPIWAIYPQRPHAIEEMRMPRRA